MPRNASLLFCRTASRRRRLHVERLEQRALLAGLFDLTFGVGGVMPQAKVERK